MKPGFIYQATPCKIMKCSQQLIHTFIERTLVSSVSLHKLSQNCEIWSEVNSESLFHLQKIDIDIMVLWCVIMVLWQVIMVLWRVIMVLWCVIMVNSVLLLLYRVLLLSYRVLFLSYIMLLLYKS